MSTGMGEEAFSPPLPGTELASLEVVYDFLKEKPEVSNETIVELFDAVKESYPIGVETDNNTIRMAHAESLRCSKCNGVEENANMPAWNTADPQIVIVALNPNHVVPYIELFINCLKEAGFSSKKALLTYMTRCTFQPSIKPGEEEIQNCFPYLNLELQHYKPKMIVTLGGEVTNFFTNFQGRVSDNIKLNASHGEVFTLGMWNILPTFSPSYINRSESDSLRKEFVSDFKKALSYYTAESENIYE